MQCTHRDIEILKFINEFGFCEMPQIEKRFDIKKPRSYQIMQRLKKANLVIHERIFHGTHGVFYLTKKGVAYTDLPPIKNIPKDNYVHQLTIIEIYFQLMKQYPKALWLSERRIIREKFKYSVGRRINHLADGVLVLPDDKEIAIEVELTMKSKKRLDDIISSYVLPKYIDEVWYYCSPITIDRVKRAAGKWEHIKVYNLDEL